MYKALTEFTDLQDRGYKYHTGDVYPRKGYTPGDKRIKELSGSLNRLGTAVIAEYDDPAETTEKNTVVKKPKRRKAND